MIFHYVFYILRFGFHDGYSEFFLDVCNVRLRVEFGFDVQHMHLVIFHEIECVRNRDSIGSSDFHTSLISSQTPEAS
ncbi:hypothetical protein NY2A_b423R [Paramecium bursaria Chlorella virus NY2A]|uniref:Uncharacterized protein b423R n=1 Tax=Paramecium bursaria Chlorella virus NY2A TaxID=46021 RepID=A7IWU8_PBCVN|nr:hypothetical protein NY2A_b423R [Paramecium bursaria Chlorella virus NY2A]YP_001498452.1 hypothetical protein AR158_c371R [Paramecium bursaria Chlorella virus AR158]ABT14822.1 hypothetical protein NY2A_b423R [Paramecium bursaria Chlorella virus NY2A]ABU43916.1 hypothetical protein AR158_c371R [Paramecium bursaria Chlorella virus AR158]